MTFRSWIRTLLHGIRRCGTERRQNRMTRLLAGQLINRCSNPGNVRSFFFSTKRLVRLWGHLVSHLFGTGCCLQGAKWLGHEADHAPPLSAEVKNEWNCNSAPSVCFMTCAVTTFMLQKNVLYRHSSYFCRNFYICVLKKRLFSDTLWLGPFAVRCHLVTLALCFLLWAHHRGWYVALFTSIFIWGPNMSLFFLLFARIMHTDELLWREEHKEKLECVAAVWFSN
jgi:hypothetical protein